MSFEKYLLPDEDDPKMYINTFQSVLVQRITNDMSGAEVKGFIEDLLSEQVGDTITLTNDEVTDIVGAINFVLGGSTTAAKLANMHRLFSIIEMAEIGGKYETQALLRAKMQELIPTWTTPS